MRFPHSFHAASDQKRGYSANVTLAYQDGLFDAAHVVVSNPQCACGRVCALERLCVAIHRLALDIAEPEGRVVTGVDVCNPHNALV